MRSVQLERQVCEVMNQMDLLDTLVPELQDIAFKNRDRSFTIARLSMTSGDEGGAAGVCGGHVGDQGARNEAGGGGP